MEVEGGDGLWMCVYVVPRVWRECFWLLVVRFLGGMHKGFLVWVCVIICMCVMCCGYYCKRGGILNSEW